MCLLHVASMLDKVYEERQSSYEDTDEKGDSHEQSKLILSTA